MSTLTQSGEEILLGPLEELEEVVAQPIPGREREWAGQAAEAVAAVVLALYRCEAAAVGPDGLFAGVDLTRPTLVRQAGALRQDQHTLRERACSLQAQLEETAQTFERVDNLQGTDHLPPPVANSAIPDFGSLRQQAEHLVQALLSYREEEARLLLESVNTDIGVGD